MYSTAIYHQDNCKEIKLTDLYDYYLLKVDRISNPPPKKTNVINSMLYIEF